MLGMVINNSCQEQRGWEKAFSWVKGEDRGWHGRRGISFTLNFSGFSTITILIITESFLSVCVCIRFKLNSRKGFHNKF